MSTPAQDIFPPQGRKAYSIPLNPPPEKDPLDAIEEIALEVSLPREYKNRGRPRQTSETGSGNSLLREEES